MPARPRETPDRWRESWRLALLPPCLALIAGVLVLASSAVSGQSSPLSLPLDDAWVRLVYARNLAQTARLEFNTGAGDVGVGSLLWVLVLALALKTVGALGLSVVAIAKGLSLLGAVGAAFAAARLGRGLAGTGVGLAAGVVVALNPAFALSAVSGLETTLFAALVLAALGALTRRRAAWLGIWLGLAVLTRLDGIILYGLVVAAWLVSAARGRSAALSRAGAIALGWLLLPGLVGIALWSWLDSPVGSWLPQSLVALRPRGVSILPDLAALWLGYGQTSVVGLHGLAWIVIGPTLLLGALWLARRDRAVAGPALVFATALGLIASASGAPRAAWSFESRAWLDPVLPLLDLLLVLGVADLMLRAANGWPGIVARAPRLARAATVATAVPVIVVLIYFLGLGDAWDRALVAHRAGTLRMNETYLAAARYIRESLPEQSLVVSLAPGAIRYVSRRPVVDLRGTHTPALAGRSPIDALADARPDYALVPSGPYFESLPGATVVRAFPAPTDPIDVPPLVLLKLTLGATASPRDRPYAFPTDRLRRLDYLDVGVDESERVHSYAANEPRQIIRRTERVSAEAAVADVGRVFSVSEVLTVAAEPGRDLILARRFDAADVGGFRVTLDGQPIGEWWPRAGSYGLAEDTLRIPGGLVRQARVTVRIELIPRSATSPASFAYWTFVDT